MTKSQFNSTWLEEIYQPKNFQTTIITGFDTCKINSITIIINDFINSMDFSFFEQYYKADTTSGGRPPYTYTTLLKIYMHARYGTPEIILKLQKANINVVVKLVKNENSKKKINDYSFELSNDEEYLICPVGQILQKDKTKDDGSITFKTNICDLCERKKECLKMEKPKELL